MALTTCSECGTQISDKAIACPKCGCPIEPPSTNSKLFPAQDIDEIQFANPNCTSKFKNEKPKFYFLIISTIIICVGLVWLYGNLFRFIPSFFNERQQATGTSGIVTEAEHSSNTKKAEVNSATTVGKSSSETEVPALTAEAAVSDEMNGLNSGLLGEWCGLQKATMDMETLFKFVITEDTIKVSRMRIGNFYLLTDSGPDSTWQPDSECPTKFSEGRYSNTGSKFVKASCEENGTINISKELSTGEINMSMLAPLKMKNCADL